MFERFTDSARRVVVLAQEEARLLRHGYIGTEHLLLGLLHEGDGLAAQALESLGISLPVARAQVQEIVGVGGTATSGHIPFTPHAKKVLEISFRESLELGQNHIGGEHILLGLLRESEGVGAQVLVRLAPDLSSVRSRVIALIDDPSGALAMPHLRITPRTAPHCSFCGRDVWEVERYLAGAAGVICEHCIAAAHAALAAAPDDQHVLVLPPRVFGTPPADDPAVIDEISEALFTVFCSVSPEQVAERLEDGERLVEILVAARGRHPDIEVVDVVVARVRFTPSGDALVAFELVVNDGGRFAFVGAVVHRDGKWIVARSTLAEVLRAGGVVLPPDA